MENELQTYKENRVVVNFEDFAMSVESVVKQVKLIQDVMQRVMKSDEHYGIIPGCKKPSLYKPGAEKLCMTFRLSPEYQIIREIQQAQIISYTVRCILTHIPTGQVIASGMGSCNSREEKYRWEYKLTPTETPVPKEYWEAKKADNNKEMKRIMGEGKRPMKVESTGQWVIAIAEKIENDNAWDYDNTILKMACKRSLIASVLNGTAASDIFTQDQEDDDGRKAEGEAAKENGLKEPGKKAPETKKTEGALTVTTKVLDIEKKTGVGKPKAGEKEGKPYTMYSIKGDGNQVYKTFSDTLADLAWTAKNSGAEVRVTFTTNQYGNSITALEIAESREPGAEG
jgi:hypothetical protein